MHLEASWKWKIARMHEVARRWTMILGRDDWRVRPGKLYSGQSREPFDVLLITPSRRRARLSNAKFFYAWRDRMFFERVREGVSNGLSRGNHTEN
jgi:hypothetical protein